MLFIEDGAPVIVQGMTGHQGMTHTARMLKAGTNIVGGVNPRKAGTSVTFPGAKNGADADIPVFATCGEAREATGAKASVVFVPPKFAKSAVVEAVEAGIELIVVITEGIPVADSAYFVELALKKGVRIIGPNCPGLITLGNPGVNLGIIPGGGGTQRLPRLIGVARAKELIFTGGVIDAKEADRIGLVNRVVPHDDLMDTCRSLAKTIAQNAGYAVSLAKEAINASGDTDLKNGLRREADLLGLAFATHDKQEGMTAFLEHRKPEFTDF